MGSSSVAGGASVATKTLDSGATAPATNPWHARGRAIVYGLTLCAYAAIVLATVRHHEPWFDEAQAWLLARDLPLSSLLFHWIRYEGSPGLWHALVWLVIRAGLPYAAFGYLAAAIAIGGVAVWLRWAPLPIPIKLIVPFTFFILYQYAVVARSYVLVPLLAFFAAHLYRQLPRRLYGFTAVLCLLGSTCLHGTALALGLAVAYGLRAGRHWEELGIPEQRRHRIAARLFVAFLLATAVMLIPPADLSAAGGFNSLSLSRIATITTAAMYSFAGVPSFLFGGLLLVWCWYRKDLAVLLAPWTLLILIFARLYMAPWHLGVFTVAGLVGAWACWPEDDELRRFTTPARRLYRATAITLLVIVAWQVYPSFTAIRHDLRAAYSGSADAAQYLKAVSAERTTVYAFGYGATAILPYFSSNIYANQVRGDPSFWRWTHDGVLGDLRWESVDAGRPEYVVFAIKRAASLPPLTPTMFMEAHGYTLVHSSPGMLWSEFGPWETDDYLIYRRTRP